MKKIFFKFLALLFYVFTKEKSFGITIVTGYLRLPMKCPKDFVVVSRKDYTRIARTGLDRKLGEHMWIITDNLDVYEVYMVMEKQHRHNGYLEIPEFQVSYDSSFGKAVRRKALLNPNTYHGS